MIPAWLASAWASVTAKAAMVAAAAGAVLGVVVLERRAGAQDQLNRDLQGTLDASKKAQETRDTVNKMSDREVHDELYRDFGRP